MSGYKLPRFVVLDGDIYVKIYKDGKYIRALNHHGVAYYSPAKALFEGFEITREEFLEAVFQARNIK